MAAFEVEPLCKLYRVDVFALFIQKHDAVLWFEQLIKGLFFAFDLLLFWKQCFGGNNRFKPKSAVMLQAFFIDAKSFFYP